jgi:hypothetical protein
VISTPLICDIDRDLDALVAALNDLPPPSKPATVSRRRASVGFAAAGIATVTASLGGATYWYHVRQQESARLGQPQQEPARLGHRIALVVGNSRYRYLHDVPNAVRDAARVSATLEQRGFRVIKALDVDKAEMARPFTEFESTLAVVGGVGLFYYAGNAAYIEGEDILIPVDASMAEQRAVVIGGLNLSRLMKEVQSRTTSTLKDNGTAVIYSASKGQVASDGPPHGNSPFTIAFLQSFSDEDELSDTFRKIRVTMTAPKAVDDKQDPYLESNLRFKFYFNHPERDPAESTAKILIFESCRDNHSSWTSPSAELQARAHGPSGPQGRFLRAGFWPCRTALPPPPPPPCCAGGRTGGAGYAILDPMLSRPP